MISSQVLNSKIALVGCLSMDAVHRLNGGGSLGYSQEGLRYSRSPVRTGFQDEGHYKTFGRVLSPSLEGLLQRSWVTFLKVGFSPIAVDALAATKRKVLSSIRNSVLVAGSCRSFPQDSSNEISFMR